MTTEGVPVISYSEQVGRKLVGTVEYTPEIRSVIGKEYAGSDIIPSEISGKLAPRFEGRVKDIADYYYGERANIETLKKSGSAATRNKATVAETKLESWVNTWGKETAKNVRSSYESQISGGEPISINFGNYENVPSTSPFTAGLSSPAISRLSGFGSNLPSSLQESSTINKILSVPSQSPSKSLLQSVYPSESKSSSQAARSPSSSRSQLQSPSSPQLSSLYQSSSSSRNQLQSPSSPPQSSLYQSSSSSSTTTISIIPPTINPI